MKCAQCGGKEMRAATMDHEVRIGDRVVRGAVPTMKCPKCGDTLTAGPDLERMELEVAEQVIAAGIVDGDTFRFLRHQLGMQAKALAPLLGTTAETISRWEKGVRDVDRPSWLALAMLVTDQRDGRNRLRAIVDAAAGKPGKFPKTVKVA